MGWSSWNTFGINISDKIIMRQADAMKAMGLADVGYDHINIDDGYFGGRNLRTGELLIHAKRFPSGLKPVVDYIHSLGLRASTRMPDATPAATISRTIPLPTTWGSMATTNATAIFSSIR